MQAFSLIPLASAPGIITKNSNSQSHAFGVSGKLKNLWSISLALQTRWERRLTSASGRSQIWRRVVMKLSHCWKTQSGLSFHATTLGYDWALLCLKGPHSLRSFSVDQTRNCWHASCFSFLSAPRDTWFMSHRARSAETCSQKHAASCLECCTSSSITSTSLRLACREGKWTSTSCQL